MNGRYGRRLAIVISALAACVMLTGCWTPIEYEDDWLDSPEVTDPSLVDPSYRVSTRRGLTQDDTSRPVIIAAHGFTASTFEWGEFQEFAEAESDVLVSRILLRGHGRSVYEFKESTWREWGRPILEEYEALVAQGYSNISLAGASTGGALLLEQISSGKFAEQPPQHVFFIDPIVVPENKNLKFIDLVGPLLNNVPQDGLTAEERTHWYTNRPNEALSELNALCMHVRSELRGGFRLPNGTRAKVYKTTGDEIVDPVSARLIYQGLRRSDGGHIDVEMIDSDLHVFTRLRGRDPADITASDRNSQRDAFEEMISRVRQVD